MRRLLSVVCSSFGDPLAEDDGIVYPPLPFSGPLAAELTERLADFGYTSVARLADLPAAELGRQVEDFLDSCGAGEVVVVHVIGHGIVNERTAKLLVVGGDGQVSSRTEVEGWLTAVEGRAAAPSVLFLVDLCYSGTVARLDWQGHIPDEQRRAWVIAATGQRDLAYDGRFSRATVAVLARIAAGDLDIAATYEFVPVERVAREIRREVDRLSEGSYEQRVVSIRSDPAAIPDFPFIPNPAYTEGPTVRIDETTRPFLDDVDEALDWRHFAARASGGTLEVDGERIRPGAFRGRRRELRVIAGVFDAPRPRPGLVLVTGSPGVGKSALLGITVCATHPELSDLTEPLWRDHRDDLPAVHDGLVAVHCRQRHLGEIVTALARQLGVPVLTADPAVLVEALRDTGGVPPVVLDALDESMAPTGVMTELILPLSSVARVVVGVRPWPEFQPLRVAAATVIDLDDVPVAELRTDLAAYIDDLLRPVYRTAALRESRQAIATTVAAVLTEPRTADDTRWGAFLVAGLYAHQLRNRPALADVTAARAAGQAVPRTLPEVFELDLTTGAGQSWRPVLTVLAHSFGAGIPRSLVDVVVGPDEAATVLDAARFYLRRDTDEDGAILYRLFHQGLADYLKRQDPDAKEALFTALISSLGSPRRWGDAEPYLLRHAADHAATTEQLLSVREDPGFLMFGAPSAFGYGTPVSIRGQLDALDFVYQKSRQKHGRLGPATRRSMVVIDAHRHGFRGLSGQLAEVVDLPALEWAPSWATTDVRDLREWQHTLNTRPSSVAIGGRPGAPLVAVGDWTGLSVTDLGTGGVTAVSFDEPFLCLAVGRWNGRVVACVRREDGPPEVWDVAAQSAMLTCPETKRFRHAVFCENAGVPLLVFLDVNHGVLALRLPDGKLYGRHRFLHSLSAVAMGSVGGRAVVVTARHNRLELTRIAGRAKQVGIDVNNDIVSLAVEDGVVLCGHRDGAVNLRSATDLTWIRRLVVGEPDLFGMSAPRGPLAVGERNGVPVAFTANQFGSVSAVELATGIPLPGSMPSLGSLSVLLPGRMAERPVVVMANSRMAGVYDVYSGERVAAFAPTEPRPVDLGQDGLVLEREHKGAVRGVAVLDDVVASASTDRTVRLWNLGTGAPGHLLDGHRDWVHTVALGRVGRRRVALTGSTDCQARLWDVESGASLGVFTGHTGWIRGAAFTPDGRGVTAAHDSTVRVWDLDTGKCVRVLTTAKRTALTSVACGSFVVAGGTGGLVHVWHSGRRRAFAGHDGAVWAVALSQVDGVDVVLSGGEDRVVRLWRVTDGVCVRTFTGFAAKVTTVSTGRWGDRPILVAGADDGTVLGWDLEDGALLAEATFPGTVGAVSVATEGRVVVGFGNDVGVIRLRS